VIVGRAPAASPLPCHWLRAGPGAAIVLAAIPSGIAALNSGLFFRAVKE
jgi:hypothetical protein